MALTWQLAAPAPSEITFAVPELSVTVGQAEEHSVLTQKEEHFVFGALDQWAFEDLDLKATDG